MSDFQGRIISKTSLHVLSGDLNGFWVKNPRFLGVL